MRATALLLVGALAGCALSGCGSKTGLGVPEARIDAGPDAGRDAGTDAGRDAGTDAGLDASVCVPGTVRLEASETEVVFVIDRSGSMLASFDGLPPVAGELSRWEILETAMRDALEVFDARVAVGAKFFPSRSERTVEDDCAVFPGLEVGIGPGRAGAILSHFGRWNPAGGTPVGPALREALDALRARASPTTAQFIVVATDGAPTCGPDAVSDALAVITEAHDEGIDVYVIGIASSEREVELLDVMAVAGGRPRPPDPRTGRRFYDASDPATLGVLLGDVTSDLARCVFSVPVPPDEDDEVDVQVDGASVPRDLERAEGWDWTSDRRGQLSLFGDACARATSGATVRAIITCN